MSKASIKKNFDRNLARVRTIVSIYEDVAAVGGPGRPGTTRSDLLRAAVVLLHASFEDACRSIAKLKLPYASAEVLAEIPFVGQGGKAKSVHLGDLSNHRNKTIEQLIQESVAQYLEYFSVNNGPEVDAFLKKIGIREFAEFRAPLRFGTLCTAISRRHQIVHQADKNPHGGRGHHAFRPIAIDTVREWVEVVERFIHTLLDTLWPVQARRQARAMP